MPDAPGCEDRAGSWSMHMYPPTCRALLACCTPGKEPIWGTDRMGSPQIPHRPVCLVHGNGLIWVGGVADLCTTFFPKKIPHLPTHVTQFNTLESVPETQTNVPRSINSLEG